MTVILMAAIARNGVIGRDGALPWRLPADLRRFRRVTMGHVLVMGRRTYDSIGRPLPGRKTVVITRQPDWGAGEAAADGLYVAGSVADALDLAAGLATPPRREVFVQGGAQIYAEALPLADVLELTWVDAEPAGDTMFPPVDWTAWTESSRERFPGGIWSTYDRLSGPARPPAEILQEKL